MILLLIEVNSDGRSASTVGVIVAMYLRCGDKVIVAGEHLTSQPKVALISCNHNNSNNSMQHPHTTTDVMKLRIYVEKHTNTKMSAEVRRVINNYNNKYFI